MEGRLRAAGALQDATSDGTAGVADGAMTDGADAAIEAAAVLSSQLTDIGTPEAAAAVGRY